MSFIDPLLAPKDNESINLTDNAAYLKLFKSNCLSLKENYKKLDWETERQMLCRFQMAEKVIDFTKVNSWIDIGCGTGDFFHHILSKHPIDRVVGLDALPEFIVTSKAINSDRDICYIVDNLMHFKHNEKYDLVTMSGLLQCLDFDKLDNIFSILVNLVNEGGQLWLDTLNYDYHKAKQRRKSNLWRYKNTELIEILEKQNFVNVESHPFNHKTEKTNTEDCFLLYLYGIKKHPHANIHNDS